MNEQARILVVDDDPDIRQLLRVLLRDYRVEEAESGVEAVQRLRADAAYDLIILDIMMPGMDGVDTCQILRRFSASPVLFLTAKTQLGDKAAAYASGGDDFLPKPFSQAELVMKVDSLLRRYCVYKGKREAYQAADVQLDEQRRCAVKRGKTVELTAKEFEILRYFFRHQGKPLEVRTLYEEVWGDSYMSSSANTVTVHVLNLRKKLEEDPANPQLIRTIWGKGYQFG